MVVFNESCFLSFFKITIQFFETKYAAQAIKLTCRQVVGVVWEGDVVQCRALSML